MKFDITASVVLYHNNREKLAQVVSSFLNTQLSVKLILIDNSKTDDLKDLSSDPRVEYIFNNKNLGFGKAHNIALRESIETSKYHLVLNPDIYFNRGVLEEIYNFMEKENDIGQLMPKILYPDGQVQYLCKLLPTPFDLIFRRFLHFLPIARKRNEIYELKGSGYNQIMNVPYLSGCFMFFRSSAINNIGFFDERIFMYIEDADITRRLHSRYRTVFYPYVHVYHHYAKGSYKSFKLMLFNIHGAFIYFTKWGWIFDSERVQINDRVLKNYLK